MASLKSLSSGEFIALANAVAAVIIDGKSGADTILLGDFISLVGDIVSTAGAQKVRLEAATGKNTTNTQTQLTEIVTPNPNL